MRAAAPLPVLPVTCEFQIDTAYDAAWLGYPCGPSTLHFIDGQSERWTTLRGLHFVHGPQVYRAGKVLSSPVAGLLWSETHTDWVHEGEADKLKRQREHQRTQQREQARQREETRQRKRAQPVEQARRRTAPPPRLLPNPTQLSAARPATIRPLDPEPEPELAWLREGLVCIGCGQRTMNWQNAQPGLGKCVCNGCFAVGVRLQ